MQEHEDQRRDAVQKAARNILAGRKAQVFDKWFDNDFLITLLAGRVAVARNQIKLVLPILKYALRMENEFAVKLLKAVVVKSMRHAAVKEMCASKAWKAVHTKLMPLIEGPKLVAAPQVPPPRKCVMVAIDTSMNLGSEELNSFAKEIKAIKKHEDQRLDYYCRVWVALSMQKTSNAGTSALGSLRLLLIDEVGEERQRELIGAWNKGME